MNGSKLGALLLAILASVPLAPAADKKREPESYAIIAGTVFRDPGFALPEASVTLMLRGDPKAKKLQQTVTTPRGEFSFRVPPAPAAYIVRASLKGFRPEEKETSISGQDRVDVTFTLAVESK